MIASSEVFRYKDNAAEAIRKIFKPDTADIHFEFDADTDTDTGDASQRIAAHKALLSAESPVFAAMFSGNWSEKSTVRIVDATHDAFNEFLRYFYEFEVCLHSGNVHEMMNMARKYEISSVEQSCLAYLLEHVTVSNVIKTMSVANLYNLESLQSKCDQIVSQSGRTIIKLRSFRECDPKLLSMLLRRGSLFCSAEEIVDACFQWAGCQRERQHDDPSCAHNLRALFGDSLELIPFDRMPLKALADRLSIWEELCSKEDLVDIFTLIGNAQPSPSAECSYWRQIQYPFSVIQTLSHFYTPSRIGFQLNRRVLFKAFRYTKLVGRTPNTPYENMLKVVISVNRRFDIPCEFKHIEGADTDHSVLLEIVGKKIVFEPDSNYQLTAYCTDVNMLNIRMFQAEMHANDPYELEIIDKNLRSSTTLNVQFAALYFEQCDSDNDSSNSKGCSIS